MLLQLDPSEIAIRENVRFALKPYRVERLAEEIMKDGRINDAIEVTKLAQPDENGKQFLLNVGHYRHAAIEKLNKEQNLGLKLPARLASHANEKDRVLRQISENSERENMSPMDKAVAIARLRALGVDGMAIRRAFAAPGGRKGFKVQPASNSHINILSSLLDFPKDIQRKIHDGIIGTNAAYELHRYPRDKWDAILKREEESRIKDIDSEEKEEAKFLEAEKSATAKEQEAQKAANELAVVKDTADKASAVVEAKLAELNAAFAASNAKGLDKDARKAVTERLKSAQAEKKSAEDAAEKAAKELSKIEDKRKSLSDKAAAAKARLEEARNKGKATPAKATPTVGAGAIRKAAKKEGAAPKGDPKPVPLKVGEHKDAIKSLIILSKPGRNPKTRKVGEVIISCLDGIITDGQMQLAVARLLGEEPMPTEPVPPAKK